MGKRFGILGLLWAAATITICWILLQPVFMNAWALETWKSTPCHLDKQGSLFTYAVGDQKYMSTRTNFWLPVFATHIVAKATPDLESNAQCLVSPWNPEMVVFRADKWMDWSNSSGRFVSAAMVIVVAGGLTYAVKKRQKGRGHAGAQTSEIACQERSER